MITLFLVASLALAKSPAPGPGAPKDWPGEYSLKQMTEEDEEHWVSTLSIENCTEKTCKFSFSSGSERSGCAAEGEFKFKSATKNESKAESKQGECLVTFERKAKGAIFVDGEGSCNDLCGMGGARYFAVELAKTSDKKFYHPSFACVGQLSKIEAAICTSETLSGLDRELSEVVTTKKTPLKDKRAWMKSRDVRCSKDTEKCLETAYRERLTALKK